MGVIWYKVWSDLWDNKFRTILAVLSISAGVFAIGAMFGMADQLMVGMDTAHQATFPSHIQMFLTDFIDQDTATRLKTIPGIKDIEVMNQTTIRYKVNPEDEWERGSLVMRDDYENQIYDTLQLKEGEWPQKNEIGIERLSSQFYGIDIGDSVIFELDKTDRALLVSNKIRHPFVPPPQFGGEAYFFIDAQGMERFNITKGEFGNVKVQVSPYSLELAKDVASEMKSRLAKEDKGVAVTFFQDPDKHWGRQFVEGMTLVLQILAVVTVLASVVLVINTMTAIITQQTDQIGIIKAVGGRTQTIITIYITGVLVYGILALIISLPLGAFLAFGITQWFLNLFNIDYETFQISSQAVFYQFLAAIVAPILAAMWPILSGATITVREAIASYGLGGGNYGNSWFDRTVEGFGRRFLNGPYAMALGNMFRRKGRLILTQLALIMAGTMFLIVMSLSSSITYTLDNEFLRRKYDLFLIFEGDQRIDRALKIVNSMSGIDKAEVWFTQSASILKEGQRASDAGIGAALVGVSPGSDIYKPLLVKGRWLQPDDGKVIVLNRETAEKNEIKLGDVVTLDLNELGKAEWTVVGLYQVIFGGGFNTDDIFAPLDAAYNATKTYNKGSLLRIRTKFHSAEYTEALRSKLVDLFAARNIDILLSETIPQTRTLADAQFSINTTMLLALAIIVAIVGGIGLMGSLSISVVERTREIGVMRAIGARTPIIMGMFIMEGILQGFFSWLIAVPLSMVLARSLAKALGQAMFDANLDYQYDYMAIFIWLVVILIISTVASILPARNATTVSVRDSLAYG